MQVFKINDQILKKMRRVRYLFERKEMKPDEESFLRYRSKIEFGKRSD